MNINQYIESRMESWEIRETKTSLTEDVKFYVLCELKLIQNQLKERE